MVSKVHKIFVKNGCLFFCGVAGAALGVLAAILAVDVSVLEFVEVEHYVRRRAQVAIETVQCDSNYVSMANAGMAQDSRARESRVQRIPRRASS